MRNEWLKARYLSGLSFSSQVNWTEWFIIIISFIIIIRYAGIKHALNNWRVANLNLERSNTKN